MRILISTIAHDAKIDTLPVVVESINKMMEATPDTTDYFIGASVTDENVISFCIENSIRYECISFNEKIFNKHTRTISFPYAGYDEFYLYRALHARKMCFALAIREEYDYILFIDSDNLVDPNALNLLLEENKHDISGWYFFKNVPHTSGGKEIPKGDPYTVTFTGCGCRLIHRDVFKRADYEFYSMTSDDMVIGKETMRLGHKIWIHPKVYSEHLGGAYNDETRNYWNANKKQ